MMTHKCLNVNTLTKKDDDGVRKLVLTKRDMSPEFYSGDRLPRLTWRIGGLLEGPRRVGPFLFPCWDNGQV